LEPEAAGRRLADLSRQYDFSFFEYWSTDYAGHKQDMKWAIKQLEMIDQVLRGLLEELDKKDLLLLTSDHGNMEDLSVRRHTSNPVPLLLVGPKDVRRRFGSEVVDIAGIAPLLYELVTA
jgi:2,3-bisphosphoglycerate-independent phosphoglycerate mutase